MGNILMVPVQLDALYVEHERVVVQATADFSKLPYASDGHDFNPNNPYISEEIVSKPFQNNNFLLQSGIHLHWSLPDALTRGQTVENDPEHKTSFPIVPNRWLIRKSLNGKTLKEWIVLSDFLTKTEEGRNTVCVPNPTPQQPGDTDYIPFRFMGKSLPFEVFEVNTSSEDIYYPELSIFGYGEPTFAAFYPNCHSVFGFHDSEMTGPPSAGLAYDLIGWYSDPGNDFLSKQLSNLTEEVEKRQHILDTLKWSIPSENQQISGQTAPTEMLCYSRITFTPDANLGEMRAGLSDEMGDDVTIAVGITGPEALSAYLAKTFSEEGGGTEAEVAKHKLRIENQLEALLMGFKIEDQLDGEARFRQYQHEKGFTAEDGGFYWIIQKEGDEKIKDDTADTMWNHMRGLLSELNTLQLEYDQAIRKTDSLKEQLYADWYKYMVCAYPPEQSWRTDEDVDELKFYIEKADIEPLEDLLHLHQYLENVLARKHAELSGELAKINNRLTDKVHVLNIAKGEELNRELEEEEVLKAPQFTLTENPRPRFWKPKDPVVLVEGPALQASSRYGKDGSHASDGRLPCALLIHSETVESIIRNKSLSILWVKIEQIARRNLPEVVHPAFHIWTDQSWNPLFLEWKTQLLGVKNGANSSEKSVDFDSSYIVDNFKLKENDPDVSYRPKGESYQPSASIYAGSSILTPFASKYMAETLEAYLSTAKSTNTPLYKTAALAKERLTDGGLHTLSQALGGFNESLLMRKESLELKIKDPLAFPSTVSVTGNGQTNIKELILDQLPRSLHHYIIETLTTAELTEVPATDTTKSFANDFTKRIEKLVGHASLRAPLPQNDFNPLRAGKLSITHLRVVDTFGQAIDLDINDGLITSEYLEAPGNPYQVLLRPRFLQAAQVHFRWLSAIEKQIESNQMKHYNPICGWVMTNKLDKSLLVFDATGKALGAFGSTDGDWKPAPGTQGQSPLDTNINNWVATAPTGINEQLYKMMYFLATRIKEGLRGVGKDPHFLTHFLASIDSALSNIEPDTFGQHNSIAQLIGRPLALVRASLDLTLKAPAAIHQGWDVFSLDMERRVRETTEFTKVQFPIRIGEHDQLNDAVVGYWVENEDGSYKDDTFFSPSSDEQQTPHIDTHLGTAAAVQAWHNESGGEDKHEAHEPVNQYQTLDDDPLKISLLFDPRGQITLTTGLLPVKTLDIPSDLYTEAMEQMEVYFVSSPHLIGPDGLHFSLPATQGYEWSFIKKEQEKWKDIEIHPHPTTETLFSGENTILEGWLKLKPTTNTATTEN